MKCRRGCGGVGRGRGVATKDGVAVGGFGSMGRVEKEEGERRGGGEKGGWENSVGGGSRGEFKLVRVRKDREGKRDRCRVRARTRGLGCRVRARE